MKTPSPPLSSKLLVHGCPPKPSLPCPSHCPSPLCEPRPFHPAVPSRPPCVATLTTSQTTHIPPNGAVPPRLLLPLPPRCLEGPQGLRQARPPVPPATEGWLPWLMVSFLPGDWPSVALPKLMPWGWSAGCLVSAGEGGASSGPWPQASRGTG